MSETQTVTVISKVPTHIRAGVKFSKGKHAYPLTAEQLEKIEADPHLRVVASASEEEPEPQPKKAAKSTKNSSQPSASKEGATASKSDASETNPPEGAPSGGGVEPEGDESDEAAEQLATEVAKLLGAGVESLKQALPRETDPGLLEAALAAEQAGGQRSTAIKAIEARLAELQAAAE